MHRALASSEKPGATLTGMANGNFKFWILNDEWKRKRNFECGKRKRKNFELKRRQERQGSQPEQSATGGEAEPKRSANGQRQMARGNL